MPRLTIAIPTYNRSGTLTELLESIAAQDCDDIEVLVCDDASPDDTPAAAGRFEGRIRNFRFVRHESNLGLDRNFLAAVDMARGDYVWLMGDDDRLEPGGVERVLAALARWPGVCGLTLGVIDYDESFSAPTAMRMTPPTGTLNGVDQLFSAIPELLGFMSALVVDRSRWLNVCRTDPVERYFNYYVQVYILARMVGPDGLWGIVQEPCVGFRTSNDQFLAKFGWFPRLRMDVVAYDQIADAVLAPDSPAKAEMLRKVFRTHVVARIVNAKTGRGSGRDTAKAMAFLARRYWREPGFWRLAFPMLLMPGPLLKGARRVYHAYSASSGVRRARALAGDGGARARPGT